MSLSNIFNPKHRNSFLNKLEIKLRHRSLFSTPEILQIEPTNLCNLDCIVCGRKYWDPSKNKLGNMDRFTFQKLLPYLKSANIVRLFGYGEPFLSGDLLYFLDVCKKNHCIVRITTNAMCIDKDIAESVVKKRLDVLDISLDSLDDKYLKKYRGQNLSKIKDTIQYINNAKSSFCSKLPVLGLSVLLTSENIQDLSCIVKFAKANGISHIECHHIIIYDQRLKPLSLFLDRNRTELAFRQAKALADSLGMTLILPSLEPVNRVCFQPFKFLYINWNGDVRPCTDSAFNCAYNPVLGNINRISLRNIWNSREMQRIRTGIYSRKLYGACKNCMFVNDSFESYLRYLR